MARPGSSFSALDRSVVSGSSNVNGTGVVNGLRDGQDVSTTRVRPRKSTVPEEDDGFIFKRRKVGTSSAETTVTENGSMDLTNDTDTNGNGTRRMQSEPLPGPLTQPPAKPPAEPPAKPSQNRLPKVLPKSLSTPAETLRNIPSTPSNLNILNPVSHIPHETPDNSFTTSQINLHDEETPVIRKNQKLRNQSTTGKRRSSLTNRGKRISNIGNGFIADPHSDVDPKDFSKHLDENLSDSQKLKQLLVWCLKRNLDIHREELKQKRNQSTTSTSEELTSLTIARHIEEDVLKNLIDGKIAIDWNSRETQQQKQQQTTTATTTISSSSTSKKIPNSLNITAQNNLEAFQKRLLELQQEKESLNKHLELVSKSTLSKEKLDSVIENEFASQLDPTIKKLFLERTNPASSPSYIQSFRQNLPSVELGVAQLHDGVHKIDSLTKATAMFIDKTMNELSTAAADSALSTNTTTTNTEVSPYDLLRALSRLES